MGVAATVSTTAGDSETAPLLFVESENPKIPKDTFNLAYMTYFILGVGYLLPWNAFITAVDYFSYLYPASSVDRVFAVVNMTIDLVSTSIVVGFAHKSRSAVRINVGLALFTAALVGVPLVDAFYVKGNVGIYGGFYVTLCFVLLCGTANGLTQGSVIGSAAEMPERYMQAVISGTATSGVLVNLLRILTKAMYPQNAEGLRKSANLYFLVGIGVMVLCIVSYNCAPKLPVIKYYRDLKAQAMEQKGNAMETKKLRTSGLFDIFGALKWHGIGILTIFIVTMSIFPGYITEDVHSEVLGDWYPILLITACNMSDLIGNFLTSVYVIENAEVAIGACFGRLLFLPLFYVCVHGPMWFRTEVPVVVLTCLLGLTNGYLSCVFFTLGPKTVELHHAETAGIVLVLFLVLGMALGSMIAWFWALW